MFVRYYVLLVILFFIGCNKSVEYGSCFLSGSITVEPGVNIEPKVGKYDTGRSVCLPSDNLSYNLVSSDTTIVKSYGKRLMSVNSGKSKVYLVWMDQQVKDGFISGPSIDVVVN